MKNNLTYMFFRPNRYQCTVANLIYANNVCLACSRLISDQYRKSQYMNANVKTVQHNRSFSNGPSKTPLPTLTSLPVVYWPSILKTVKNIILSKLIIRPYYDHNFSLEEFTLGTKHAVGVVSTNLSEGNLQNLKNLITEDVFEEIKVNISKFSYKQILQLKIDPNDIYFSFPYEIGVIIPDESNPKRRIIEITMCYHVLSGYRNLIKSPEFSLQMTEYEDKLHVLNYRFFKELTVGISNGDWTINALNHCKPLASN